MKRKVQGWDDLERFLGLNRTAPRSFTQRDAANLTRRRLKGPFWPKRKR